MDKSVSMEVVKKLNTGTERKDLMLLKVDSMCNWEQFLMPAPVSIAILGQLMAIATKQDFKFDGKEPVGGYRYLKYPNSFRACLVQISNSTCEAFMEAHRSMDRIYQYTSLFQETMRDVVTILISGDEQANRQSLPEMFDQMKTQANTCLKLAEKTENMFYHVMLLVDETSEVSAAVKGVYESSLVEARRKMKLLETQEKQIKEKKRNMEKEKKRVINDLSEAKTAFEKSMDQVPGIGTMLIMTTVEEGLKIATGAMDMFGQYKMLAVSKGLSVLTSFSKGNSEETSQSSTQSQNITVQDDQHQSELKVAYQHAKEIHACIEKMYEMFTDSKDSKGMQDTKVEVDVHSKTLNEIKQALAEFEEEFKSSNFAKTHAVVETSTTCSKGIELCEEILKIKKENASELFKKVDQLKAESKRFQLKARNFFQCSPVSIPDTAAMKTGNESQSKRAIEIASENARYEVEIRRKELDDAKRAREHFHDEIKKMEEKQNSVLEGLSKTKIDEINFIEIQKTLKEGLLALSQLKEQWSCLVLFFQNITSRIEICLSQKTSNMDKHLKAGNYNVGNITRNIVLEMAASVNSIAYAVQLISKAYTEISIKHLVPNTASLVKLIALDPEKDKDDLKLQRDQIDNDCKKAKDEIILLAEESRNQMELKIQSMYTRLEEQTLPPLPPAKIQEIKENVENSDMNAADYI